MPKVWNKYHDDVPKKAISVMRGQGPYGNPFRVGTHGDRDECCDLHQDNVLNHASLDGVAAIEKLRGHDLVCCCKPKRCHGDFLFVLANTDPF